MCVGDRRAGALSSSGWLAAGLTGGVIFGLGGLPWAVLLLTFFVSSSALSKAFAGRKARLSEKFAKGSRRDAGQVLANGGLGAALVLAFHLIPAPLALWAAYLGSLAAVNADTWATELGVLNPQPPRLITSGKRVEAGASGGVSLWGFAASLGGALLIGLMGGLFSPGEHSVALIVAATLGGVGGSLFDSWLGATVQAIYFCPSCQKETERHPRHICGEETNPLRGWRWLNNDWVNALASAMGAGIAGGLFNLLR